MEKDVEEEVREYAARRQGGTSPRALALVALATRLYGVTLKTLRRFGGASPRFWDALEVGIGLPHWFPCASVVITLQHGCTALVLTTQCQHTQGQVKQANACYPGE